MSNTYYLLHTDEYIFQILQTDDFGKRAYVLLNDEGKACVSVNVKNASTELYLSRIKFYKTCAVNKCMERGESTLRMVKALLRFLAEKEDFEKITFIDTSSFDCLLVEDEDDSNIFMKSTPLTIQISLSFHNLTIYGETWYMRSFGATLSNNHVYELLQESIKKLRSTIIEKDDFYIRFHENIMRTRAATEVTSFQNVLSFMLELLDAYVNLDTWMNYFFEIFSGHGLVAKKYGSQYACSLYYMFDNAVNTMFQIPFECDTLEMEISRTTILKYPELSRVEENKSPKHKKVGGGTKTRKFSRYVMSIPKYSTTLSFRRKYKEPVLVD
jgi:hypothetical protein